ncbi:hypothetical protein EII07_28575 [Klebsiella pneumoniae]|nr:hypothetical protein [Klebsiella pneumoniae]
MPAGVVALKKREFRELKQGNRSVMEYLHEFNNLARYAPEDVREDEEKQEKLSHPDFCFRIYKLFNKLLLEFILNVH